MTNLTWRCAFLVHGLPVMGPRQAHPAVSAGIPPACPLRCLTEDATDADLSSVERLALVRDRARCMRDIRRTLAASIKVPR